MGNGWARMDTDDHGGSKMAEQGCATCALRARHDRNPRSLLGRLWRWHAGWCPGFEAYMLSLPDVERRALADKYRLAKYK